MPRQGSWWLEDFRDEPIFVMCTACEILRKIEYNELMERYGNTSMTVLIDAIAKEWIGCSKEFNGIHNRCRLHYYNQTGGVVARQNAQYVRTLDDLASWEVVIAKCQFCSHVSNIESWRIRKIASPGMTITDLKRRLRCRNCKRKGEVNCTIAKLPR